MFQPNGTFVTAWGWKGAGPGQLDHPAGLAINASGQAIVADRDNHRVQVFQPSTSDETLLQSATWGTNGSGDGQFNQPYGVAVDPQTGEVYVADYYNHRIQVFDAAGSFKRKWGSYGAADGQLAYPSGIALDSSKSELYISEWGNHRVSVFNKAGTFKRRWGGPSSGSANGAFNGPRAVAVDATTGRVYVADFYNHRVQIFNGATGDFIRGIGNGVSWAAATAAPTPANGNLNRWFYGPAGIAVDPSTHTLLVSEFTTPGTAVLERLSVPEQMAVRARQGATFGTRSGLAVDFDGSIYVTDSSNDRVQKYASSGRFITTWGSGGNLDGLFSGIYAVAVDTATGAVVTAKPITSAFSEFRARSGSHWP